MNGTTPLTAVKRICTGLSFIVFPLIWVFAFAVHPNLLHPRLMLGPEELILRAHHNGLLQFGHALVTVNAALLVVVALHFMHLLDHTTLAGVGFIGAVLAIFGAFMLAADKGALCLTLSALDTLPEDQFTAMMPGLVAIFSMKGWVALAWGMPLMPVGVVIQTVAMLKARVLPPWQLAFLLTGVAFIALPDGAEIINLIAALLMATAMLPLGVRLLNKPPAAGEPASATSSQTPATSPATGHR